MFRLEIEDADGITIHLHFNSSIGAVNAYEHLRYWSSDVLSLMLSTNEGPQMFWRRGA